MMGQHFDVTYRSLATNDIDSVAALEAKLSPEPWSADLFAGELEVHAAARNWIVAYAPNGSSSAHSAVHNIASPGEISSLVGFAGMMFVEDEGHLMNIAVDSEFQGQGVATQLLRRLTLDAVERGVTNLTLEVRSNNTPALALYRRFGYRPVGVRKGYYVDGQDALIMWAHDVNSDEYLAVLGATESAADMGVDQ